MVDLWIRNMEKNAGTPNAAVISIPGMNACTKTAPAIRYTNPNTANKGEELIDGHVFVYAPAFPWQPG